jgi:hypothetical protein
MWGANEGMNKHMQGGGAWGDGGAPLGRESVERLVEQAREEVDRGRRLDLFLEAMRRAGRCGEVGLERDALSQAVLFSIGTGDPRELVRLFWPEFSGLEEGVFQAGRQRDRYLWAAERVLYFAPEYPELPLEELERALGIWLEALRRAGGYERKTGLRLQLHHSLRLGRIEKAGALLRALEAVEPESDFVPRAGLLPGEEPGGRDGGLVDFGCQAYANQVRVLYHCARGDAIQAWRCARYLVDGRSACGLSLCAAAPREALAALLEPLDRAGLNSEADVAHRMGLPMVRGVAAVEGLLGHHLRHLVRRGATEQARDLLEPALVSGPAATTPFQRFHLLRGALAVFRAVPATAGRCAALREEAAGLAERFDLRNGGDSFRQLLGECVS